MQLYFTSKHRVEFHLGEERTRFYLGTPTRHFRAGAMSERAAAGRKGGFTADGIASEASSSRTSTKYRSSSLELHANVVVPRNNRLFLPLPTWSHLRLIGCSTVSYGETCYRCSAAQSLISGLERIQPQFSQQEPTRLAHGNFNGKRPDVSFLSRGQRL